MSANDTCLPFADTLLSSTVQLVGSTPSSAAPASRRMLRPAAPACEIIVNDVNTDHEPPVISPSDTPGTSGPHFGSLSACTKSTSSQFAPSSSAMMRASAVPTCCPISAFGMFIMIPPSPFISNHMVGAKLALAPPFAISDATCSSLQPGNTTPRPIISPAPALLAKKVRRVTADCTLSARIAMTMPPRRQRRP